MRAITKRTQQNLALCKQLMDTLRVVTPGEGRYGGVTDEEADALARQFARVVYEQQDLLGALRVAQLGPAKACGQALGRALVVATTVEIGRRRGGAGVLAFLAGTYGVGAWAQWARTR